jgi:hypothetical protein
MKMLDHKEKRSGHNIVSAPFFVQILPRLKRDL